MAKRIRDNDKEPTDNCCSGWKRLVHSDCVVWKVVGYRFSDGEDTLIKHDRPTLNKQRVYYCPYCGKDRTDYVWTWCRKINRTQPKDVKSKKKKKKDKA